MSIPKPSEDSNGKPRALLIAPEVPYPVAGGGPLRTASLLEYLAARYSLDVITFHEPGNPHPASLFPEGLVERLDVIELPFHSQAALARVLRNADRFARGAPPLVDRFSGFSEQIRAILADRSYDLAVVEHFWCAGYVKILRERCKRVVLDLHNVESVLLARCGDSHGRLLGTAFKRFAAACRRMECELLPQFTDVLVCSSEDAEEARACAPEVRVTVYPNSIPYCSVPFRSKGNSIVFSGNMRYAPNRSAAQFFHRCVWPLVRKQWPDLTWQLVGRESECLPKELRFDPSVQVIGAVKDAVEALAGARVAVAPLLAGSGTRLKIIEAWAAGVPVVSTTVGAEGLPAESGKNLLVADTPHDFASAISSLLASEELCNRLATNARQHFERSLNWSAAWLLLEAAGY